MSTKTLNLLHLPRRRDALRHTPAALNPADAFNGNHGDHMIEIFQVASNAAQAQQGAGLAQAMLSAADQLDELPANGSARLYAIGLRQVGEQFQKYGITLDDLVSYVNSALDESPDDSGQKLNAARSGEVLKALVAGIAGWGPAASGQANAGLNMGALFEFGMAYLQAKQRGGSRIEVLSDAAASVSPLRDTPHRYVSGKLSGCCRPQAHDVQQAWALMIKLCTADRNGAGSEGKIFWLFGRRRRYFRFGFFWPALQHLHPLGENLGAKTHLPLMFVAIDAHLAFEVN
jgi:hypothetical protein